MTSGNLSDEPIAHDDDDAVARLGPLVDGLLTHDRPIHIRCDDSVVRATAGRLQVLRRSRGYAPEPLRLPFTARRPVLAVGAELKSTVSVAKDGVVVPSHHIGDLEHLATYRSFLQAVDHLPRLYGVVPEVVAHDLHPEYLSTKLASSSTCPRSPCSTTTPTSPRAWSSTAAPSRCSASPSTASATAPTARCGAASCWWPTTNRRVGSVTFAPYAMPGGVAAIREPWRMAAVWAAMAPATTMPRAGVRRRRRGGDGRRSARPRPTAASPSTTSVGRLFDAVAALLGGRQRVSYEAQAAIELEALARTVARADAPKYAGCVTIAGGVLDPAPLVAALLCRRSTQASIER